LEKTIKKIDNNIFVTGDSGGLGYEICKISSNYFSKVTGLSRKCNLECNWDHVKFDLLNDDLQNIKNYLYDADTLVLNAAMAHTSLCVVGGIKISKKVFLLNYHIPTQMAKIWARGRIKQRKKGHLIFISSICSKKAFKGLADYSASKSAINSFAKVMATELGGKGIRVNTVMPGYMKTNMTKDLSKEQVKKISQRIPSEELLKPSDVANSIICLMKSEFSFCNGSEFVIDGGQVL
jgi:NAD(P)-dependent dehydrogenase (short-subunit alcohol dehydrogenase family)